MLIIILYYYYYYYYYADRRGRHRDDAPLREPAEGGWLKHSCIYIYIYILMCYVYVLCVYVLHIYVTSGSLPKEAGSNIVM